MSIESLLPDLKTGTTLAILNSLGTIPREKEFAKICFRGAAILEMIFWVSQTEIPERSRVFLLCSRFVASIISVAVTGESVKLKRGMSSLNDGASEGRSEGLISFTIDDETEVKKHVKMICHFTRVANGLVVNSNVGNRRGFEIRKQNYLFYFC